MPSTNSYVDNSVSSESDSSLICGFGPRRTREENGSLNDSTDSTDFSFDEDGIAGDNTDDFNSRSSLICEFGDTHSRGGFVTENAPADDSAPDSGSTFEEKRSIGGNDESGSLNSKFRECIQSTSEGPRRDKIPQVSDGEEDGATARSNNMKFPTQNILEKSQSCYQTDSSIASMPSLLGSRTRSWHPDIIESGSTFLPLELNSNHKSGSLVKTNAIPAQGGDYLMGNSQNRRPDGMGSFKTSTSDDCISTTSEDAVVLMIDTYRDKHDSRDGSAFDDSSFIGHVIGRIFRGQQTNDYESIPRELEIQNEISVDSSSEHYPQDSLASIASMSVNTDKDRAPPQASGQKEITGKFKPGMDMSGVRDQTRSIPPGGCDQSTEADVSDQNDNLKTRAKRENILLTPTKPPSANENNHIDRNVDKKRSKFEQGQKSGDKYESEKWASSISPKIDPSVSAPNTNNKIDFPKHPPSTKQNDETARRQSTTFDQNLHIIEESDHDSAVGTTWKKSPQSNVAGLSNNSIVSSRGETEVLNASFSSFNRATSSDRQTDSTAKNLRNEENRGPTPRAMPVSKMTPKSESKSTPEDKGRQAIVSRNSDLDYVKKTVPKPLAVKTFIHGAIAANILFKACSEEELVELVDVFAPNDAPAGSIIIRQGDEGDAFYVMERGTVDVYEGDIHKATLHSGTSFGEIALLYGCPRSATLRARYFCKLWSISRAAFRGITRQFKRRRNEAKVKFLKKVKIKDKLLCNMLTETEINTLALATLNERFSAGHIIIREGDPGDIFYMIDSGSVDVLTKAMGDKPVATLRSGEFFGEQALLSNDVRSATVVAKTDVKCHILMRKDFNLLLGDLQSFMDEAEFKTQDKKIDQGKKQVKETLKVCLNDLEILQVLGTGAFGRVRLAKLNRLVDGIENEGFFALKCISKQSLKDSGLESHILNEKAIMSSLDHPFINRFYCDMEDNEHLYFLLEALTGGELCKRLRNETKFPEAWGKFYSASVLFAFCHMHAKKIAYRDLKPENLVMDFVGYVKIVDFGLAKVIEGGKTWTLCGTPAYLAPEIVLNDGHDWAVDYWALGVFLFEMTSGKEPFRASNPMEIYKQIISGHVEIPSFFSSTLSDLVRKLLNTSKSKRLGRTMGGGGAVMQHRWYAGFDWDAHLQKRLPVPLQPHAREVVRNNLEDFDARKSGRPSRVPSHEISSGTKNAQITPDRRSEKMTPNSGIRVSYSLGQGNRHHRKLLKMMGNNGRENSDYDRQNDTVRMTMMRVITQHERWSILSDQSTNSSTRNTLLCVGGHGTNPTQSGNEKTGSRSSFLPSSNLFGDNLDAFLRLQLMHLSLASKRESQLVRDRTFQQFSLLSIHPSSLIDEEPEFCETGRRFLDPFTTKNVDLIDQFPSLPSESDIDAEALAAFCFPNGLRIRIIPRCAEEGARKLGWLGQNGDNYQLQGFTDVSGSLSHGIAITVREELTHTDAPKVLDLMAILREKRRSAGILCRWWRKLMKRAIQRPRRSVDALNGMKRKNNAGRLTTGTNSVERMHSSKRMSSEDSFNRSEIRNSAIGLRAAMDRVISRSRSRRGKIKSASMGDLTCESDHSDDLDHDLDSSNLDEGTCNLPQVPEHIRQLGLSAFQTMIDTEKEGDMCIIEKSYVVIGAPLQDQSLFFCALQNLVDMERKTEKKSSSMETVRKNASDGDDDISSDQINEIAAPQAEGLEERHAILSALQTKLSLSPLQRRISHPRSEMAHIKNAQRRFILDLSITGYTKISTPLPLPRISGQWGLATLFLRIKDSGLIILLKLLLLERSVLVLGETSEEVTACATALLELLDPYKWASAFMPLLPREMLDFVSSPVPFIAGMIVESKRHLHDIIHDYGVKDAMLHGLSIVNLVSGKLIVTREQGTSDMLRRSFQTIPELSFYQRRLEEHRRKPSSTLRSFKSFFQNGASPKESLTLTKIKAVIKKHLTQFTMGLNDRPDAWQQYGEFNEATGTFDFCPDKFIQPLKDRMIFQIQFQEMMAHTQLFVGYVEELQRAHEKRSKMLAGPEANFIARWVELHWYAKHSRSS